MNYLRQWHLKIVLIFLAGLTLALVLGAGRGTDQERRHFELHDSGATTFLFEPATAKAWLLVPGTNGGSWLPIAPPSERPD